MIQFAWTITSANWCTLLSLLLSNAVRCRATQPPCLPGALMLVVSGFSQPRLALPSFMRSARGSQSETVRRWEKERMAEASSWAMDVLVCNEVSTRRGR